jgi:hypothetical protein
MQWIMIMAWMAAERKKGGTEAPPFLPFDALAD